jgi:peptidyl-tRNA hydrolase, PTH1 family
VKSGCSMIVVIGLGNPGEKYEASRHNLGFQVVDKLAGKLGAPRFKEQFEALVARGDEAGQAFCLCKPQTFMNLSGQAVAALTRFYKVPLADCVVVTDDLDLPLGKLRLRDRGSDGGHRGLRSIIECLGSQEFKRIRIGIGRPPEGRTVLNHVLGGSKEEQAKLDEAIDVAADRALAFIRTGKFENWSSP